MANWSQVPQYILGLSTVKDLCEFAWNWIQLEKLWNRLYYSVALHQMPSKNQVIVFSYLPQELNFDSYFVTSQVQSYKQNLSVAS